MGNSAPIGCELSNEVTPQLSVAVGGIQVAFASHVEDAVSKISDGQDVNTGAVLSVTTTLKLQVATFPLASVAV